MAKSQWVPKAAETCSSSPCSGGVGRDVASSELFLGSVFGKLFFDWLQEENSQAPHNRLCAHSSFPQLKRACHETRPPLQRGIWFKGLWASFSLTPHLPCAGSMSTYQAFAGRPALRSTWVSMNPGRRHRAKGPSLSLSSHPSRHQTTPSSFPPQAP